MEIPKFPKYLNHQSLGCYCYVEGLRLSSKCIYYILPMYLALSDNPLISYYTKIQLR